MMVPELKPCPFCGGEAEFIFKPIIANDPDCRTLVRVRCADCYAQSPYKRNPKWHGWFVDSKKKAADAWNRRKEDDLR